MGPDARVVGQEEQQANRVKELDAFGHKLCSFARFSELEVRGLNAGLLGGCLWYRPGLCQCRFRKGYIGPNRRIIAGRSRFTAVPGRQHNCFPLALDWPLTRGKKRGNRRALARPLRVERSCSW